MTDETADPIVHEDVVVDESNYQSLMKKHEVETFGEANAKTFQMGCVGQDYDELKHLALYLKSKEE